MNQEQSLIAELEDSIVKHFVPTFIENACIKDFCIFKLMDTPMGTIDYLVLEEPESFENSNTKIPELKLNKHQKVIELKPHSISYSLHPGSITELQNVGINICSELFVAMLNEFNNDIAKEFIYTIKEFGDANYDKTLKWYHKVIRFFFKSYKRKTKIKTAEDIVKLILKKSIKVQNATRRGGIDYIVTNQKIAAYLSDSKYFTKDANNQSRVSILFQDGYLNINNGIKIIVNPYQYDDYVLMGHRGNDDNYGLLFGIMKTVTAYSPTINSDLSHRFMSRLRCGFTLIGQNAKDIFQVEYIK